MKYGLLHVALFIALAALTACETKQIAEMNYSERKALADQLVQRCIDQGVPVTSPQFQICTSAEAQAENAKRQRNLRQAQRAQASMARGFQNASNSYSQAAAMNRTVTCQSVPAPAGMATVRCY